MNCRPGDLAWIIRDDAGEGRNLGLVVEVVRAAPSCGCSRCQARPHGAAWECMTRGRKIVGAIAFNLLVECDKADIPDAWLRPIRNPGEDAIDEMVKRVGPAPMTAPEILAWSGAS